MKTCPICHETKPVDDFPVDRWKAGGRASRCRSCDNARSRAYYAANRERVIKRVKAYQASR